MVRIQYHREKCIGCNACVEAVHDRWRLSRKDGKSTLIGSVEKKGFFTAIVPDDEYEGHLQAEKNCPVRIIKIEQF
ncbi:MAG: ferredoxin [Crocinitomicaceae bacterium]|nr:ferredoxin [Crocinitomicaceae bacterium]